MGFTSLSPPRKRHLVQGDVFDLNEFSNWYKLIGKIACNFYCDVILLGKLENKYSDYSIGVQNVNKIYSAKQIFYW